MQKIRGKFTYEVYRNEKNLYCVLKFRLENSKTITCTGYSLPAASPISYDLSGEYIQDQKYGDQFKVTSFEEYISNDKNSIIEYLSSGLIKGIGKIIANRIYDKFGQDSIDTIAKSPEKLLCIKGITKAKLKKIVDSYAENHIPKEVIDLLIPYNFSIATITKICKRIRGNVYQEIMNNPYILCNIRGISFAAVDVLKIKCNIGDKDEKRVLCAITETLKYNYFSGSVGMELKDLIIGTSKLVKTGDVKFVYDMIYQAVIAGNISYRKIKWNNKVYQYFYLNSIKQAEEDLAFEIIRCKNQKNNESKKAANYINSSDNSDIVLDQSQKDAVISAFTNNVSIITGGPGTGKTTTIKKIAEIDKLLHPKAEQTFLAPTGRAAKRITESSGLPASTIHSKLMLTPKDDGDGSEYETSSMDDDIVINNQLVIIDEFSMVDMMLALSLFKNIDNSRIVIVGDPDQLPSVGNGNVLKDMIDSGMIPVTKLKYEHRQGNNSTICDNAHLMQDEFTELMEGNDFNCNYGLSMADMEDNIVNTYVECVQNGDYKSVVALCPYKQYTAGIYSVNRRIQNILNPLKDGDKEFKGENGMVFRIGDPVMHIKKNTEIIVNGDVGKVIGIQVIGKVEKVIVGFDTPTGFLQKEYGTADIDQLILSYAMTVHKSQGSEYDAVIFGISKFHSRMLKRNIIYTAITRAKKHVYCFFDSKDTVLEAVKNNSTEERRTLLPYLLQNCNCNIKSSSNKEIVKVHANKKSVSDEIDGQMTLACCM